MNILITGSAGFVGNLLVRDLLDKGHKVTGLDITKHSFPIASLLVRKNYK